MTWALPAPHSSATSILAEQGEQGAAEFAGCVEDLPSSSDPARRFGPTHEPRCNLCTILIFYDSVNLLFHYSIVPLF